MVGLLLLGPLMTELADFYTLSQTKLVLTCLKTVPFTVGHTCTWHTLTVAYNGSTCRSNARYIYVQLGTKKLLAFADIAH